MPYDKLSDAPASLRGMKPAITLAQANGIARCADTLEDEGEVKSPWAVCIASFKKGHRVAGGKWVKREEGKAMVDTVEIDGAEVRLEELVAAYKAVSAGPDELSQRVRDAWRAKFQRDTLPAPIVSDGWVKEVCEDVVIIELDEGLFSYPYTITEDGVEFGEPTKVEIEYRPVPGKSFVSQFLPVKMLSETKDAWVIGGYGMIWGSEYTRDLSPWPNQDGTRGEFFTPETQGLDDIPVKAMTFEHDKEIDESGKPIKAAVGHTILERDDARGRWIEAQLTKGRQYAQLVVDMMSKGDLYLSSETADHWREVAANGKIKRWRTAGYTFTTHPMEPRIGSVSQVKAAYKAAGLTLPQLDEGGESAGADCQKAEAEKMKAKIEILLAQTKLLEV